MHHLRMMDMRSYPWLKFLALILTSVRAVAINVPITYLTEADFLGAVCLDGSPPAYHLDLGYGSGKNSWLVHMEGGGWCHDIPSCLRRKGTRLGSSTKMEKEIRFTSILSSKKRDNPDFHNWNRVKVRYCDGSSFTGDVVEVNTTTNLYFRGARVWISIMEELLEKGMQNAENVLLSGCSSSGLASMLHCDTLHTLLPTTTRIKCLSDGGYFINVDDILGEPTIQDYFHKVVTLHGSEKNLPSACTSKMEPSLCFFPQNIESSIRFPLFILNSAYDSWQIRNVLAHSHEDLQWSWKECKSNITKCAPDQLQIMQAFRMEFLDALNGMDTRSGVDRGLFVNSCYAHCQSELSATWLYSNSPQLNNTKIANAVGDWFYERRAFKVVDCPYPCDSTCVNFIY